LTFDDSGKLSENVVEIYEHKIQLISMLIFWMGPRLSLG